MKYLFLIPLAILMSSFDAKERGKSPVEYAITYTKPNKQLTRSEILVEFTLVNSLQQPIKDSVLASYNGHAVTLHPNAEGKTSLKLKAGKYIFQFYLDRDHQEIYTDSINFLGGCSTGLELYFQSANYEIIVDKPVIYLYPEESQQVHVALDVNGTLGYTYPEYNGGWDFISQPDGKILMNEKKYDYLFWDAKTSVNTNELDLRSGFIVSKDSLTTFFEKQLSTMGLNAREQQDFITYWCPLMQENESNYIHFMFNDECNSIASMNVSPTPDHIFRVYMLWSNASEMNPSSVHPQEVETFSRDGFDVLEWGGAKVELNSNSLTKK